MTSITMLVAQPEGKETVATFLETVMVAIFACGGLGGCWVGLGVGMGVDVYERERLLKGKAARSEQ
jgi:hypothetical protein